MACALYAIPTMKRSKMTSAVIHIVMADFAKNSAAIFIRCQFFAQVCLCSPFAARLMPRILLVQLSVLPLFPFLLQASTALPLAVPASPRTVPTVYRYQFSI